MTTTISTQKKSIASLCMAVLFFMALAPLASADSYNSNKHNKHTVYPMYQQTYQTYTSNDTEALLSQIRVLLAQLQALQARQYAYTTYVKPGNWLQEYNAQKSNKYPYTNNSNYYWYTDDTNNNSNNNKDDIPDASTDDAENIYNDNAEINGEIDMNDFEDGVAFFVYGEDQGDVEDVEDEDSYGDVSSRGDDLQKVLLSSNFNDNRTFSSRIFGLDNDTEIFYRICVGYEDEDNDDTLTCSKVESFTTDRN